MDIKSSSLNSSNLAKSNNLMRSKLRRLRIQEALLLQSIHKPDRSYLEDIDLDIEHDNASTVSYKCAVKKVRDSYIELKNLYDEVKTNTQSQELLVELDIDDLKKKVLELESNIKTFKSEIDLELAALQIDEQKLISQLNETPPEKDKMKQCLKTHSVNYNKIVPSPVRIMMTSPLKCSEVQRFQDFMKESPNRYGGWNEYNHNIFVKYWQKYFGKNCSCELEESTMQQSITFTLFKEDLASKLQGVADIDFSAHTKWYLKYLFLKEMQQNAINKWKSNKMLTRNMSKMTTVRVSYPQKDNKVIDDDIDSVNNTFIACHLNASQSELTKDSKASSICLKSKEKHMQTDCTHSFMKPTKQWLNRNRHTANVNDTPEFNHIENMGKLRTPHWRLGL